MTEERNLADASIEELEQALERKRAEREDEEMPKPLDEIDQMSVHQKVLQPFIDMLEDGVVPPVFPLTALSACGIPFQRGRVTGFDMWAIVDMAWSKELADFIEDRKVLEIMAGRGWLAQALQRHGVDIIATDLVKPHGEPRPFHVIPMDARQATAEVSAEVLIVSWPPYRGEEIVEALDNWGTSKPIVYIGEGPGGCTGCSEMHNSFAHDEGLTIPIPSWPGMHDWVQVGYWTKAGSKT